jgi:hypothetical protein
MGLVTAQNGVHLGHHNGGHHNGHHNGHHGAVRRRLRAGSRKSRKLGANDDESRKLGANDDFVYDFGLKMFVPVEYEEAHPTDPPSRHPCPDGGYDCDTPKPTVMPTQMYKQGVCDIGNHKCDVLSTRCKICRLFDSLLQTDLSII